METFLFALLAAVIWGIAPAVEKMALQSVSPFAGLVVRTVVATSIILIFSFLMGEWKEILSLDSRTILYLSLGGILGSFLGTLAYYNALKSGDVSLVVPVSSIYPLVALLIGVLKLGESITIQRIIGIILIVLGISLIK
ncbi:MAG: bacterial/archaeal transporter family protein [Archaeoglobi archaeon]|nr:bacterial/archaeal transporter family protein [Archaeoglobi archaeon]